MRDGDPGGHTADVLLSQKHLDMQESLGQPALDMNNNLSIVSNNYVIPVGQDLHDIANKSEHLSSGSLLSGPPLPSVPQCRVTDHHDRLVAAGVKQQLTKSSVLSSGRGAQHQTVPPGRGHTPWPPPMYSSQPTDTKVTKSHKPSPPLKEQARTENTSLDWLRIVTCQITKDVLSCIAIP